jgi:TonB family protein
MLAVLLLPLRFAHADAGIDEQLKSDYVGKVLTLRHFYSGAHLRFHADGTLQGDAPVGPWTLDGQIAVEEIHVRDGLLVIKGRRVYRIFDTQLKPQDELTTIDNYYGKLREDLEKTLRNLEAEIEIELPGERPDQKDISSAIHSVFLTDSESMMGIVPSFWYAYFAKQEGRSAPEPKGPVYFIRQRGEISPPRAIYAPDPNYPVEARKVKYEGTVILFVVIDAAGTTRDIQITKPLGLGLDENAVSAVSTWKFEPGQKDGKPVSVGVEIHVNFRLY